MKKLKEGLVIVILTIGVFDLCFFISYDFLNGQLTHYGFYEKAGILFGAIFTVIGLIFFIFEKYRIYEKRGIFSIKVNFFEALLVVILVIISCSVGGLLYSYYEYTSEANVETWSIGIYIAQSHEPFNFTGENVDNPVLTSKDITDVQAKFVADPFIIYENDTYYMFFEVLNANTDQGDIGLAISNDGFNWSYDQIILDECFHLSYPCVFKWNNEYYMIPETYETKSVRLYKANEFPYSWLLVKTILKGKDFVDNTIFHYENMWWLFTETGNNNVLRLYYSDNPLGPWVEHSKSPIINGNANIARPGGNVIVFDNRIIRYAQDDDPYYGNQVWAFEITTLTTKSYEEYKIGINPILKGFDNWNTRGMHQISPCQISDNKWIASVDGFS